MSTSLYDVLGANRGSNSDELKKVYRKLVLQHHPDKGGDPEKFKQIQHAYDVLSDDQRRMVYDQTGSDQEAPEMGNGGMPFGPGGPFGGMPFDIGSMFGGGNPFGGFGMPGMPGMHGMPGMPGMHNSGPRPPQPKGPPKIHEMPVSLHDYYHGKRVKVQFERQIFCSHCKGDGAEKYESCKGCGGSGKKTQIIQMGPIQAMTHIPCNDCGGKGKKVSVKCRKCAGKKFLANEKTIEASIIPGMRPHEMIVFPKECSDQSEYVEAGDLHIILQEADEDNRFKRVANTDDLNVTVAISLYGSLIGTSDKVNGHPAHPDGLILEIPVGVQHGDVINISGEGMPKKSGGRGDLRVLITLRATEIEINVLKANKEKIEQIFTS